MLQKKCESKLSVKLEAFGENSCRKWHKDFYAARAIVCYCGRGTEFTPGDNIRWDEDWWKELTVDRGRVQQAATGDMLFMKGVSSRSGSSDFP